MDESAAHEAFLKITQTIGSLSHGHSGDGLVSLRELIRRLKRRKREFLETRLFQAPRSWKENREAGVWGCHATAEENKYRFLQGDIIRSSHVIGPIGGEEPKSNWLVLSVDCDCARHDHEFFLLARVQAADNNLVGLATSFKSPKWFPIPPLSQGSDWFVADLVTPFFLSNQYSLFCDVLRGMSVEAWHILNALLQERYTRALNVEESERLRRPAK